MTIQTDINQKDWTAFTRRVVRRSRKRWAPVYLLICCGIGGGTGLAFDLSGSELHLPSFFAGLAAGIISLVIASRLIARQMQPAKDGVVLGPHEIEATEAGLRVVSRWSEAVFHWDAVRGAEVTDKYIFVMVDRNAGIIVPRRSFAPDAEREQFVSEVQARAGGLAA
jgi:hypothetical protein